jgi:hypothetical protein
VSLEGPLQEQFYPSHRELHQAIWVWALTDLKPNSYDTTVLTQREGGRCPGSQYRG